jgi:hypothetical protein
VEAATEELEAGGASEESPEPPRAVTIHVPGEDLGREGAVEPAEPEASEPDAADEPVAAEAAADTGEAPKPKKKTRRGSRGGRNRKKKPAAASQNGGEPREPAEQSAETDSANGDFEYVPMSEWADELETSR